MKTRFFFKKNRKLYYNIKLTDIYKKKTFKNFKNE